jgi:gamma-glutamyltranspeptidase/glutathione hydrolase
MLLFNSSRSPIVAQRGMVASSQPLASQAGLRILMQGGNAADAAVAMAAALNVTEPCSTGLGGDCFALCYETRTRTVHALNGSGRAPAALDLSQIHHAGLFRDRHAPIADPYHALDITVPGACAGWCDLIEKLGSLPLTTILAPAIELAEGGFPVAPLTAHFWGRGAENQLRRALGGQALTLNGRGPRPGEIFCNPGLGRTLRVIAEGGKTAFYTGKIAESIARTVQRAGGVLTVADLAEHTSTWETPLSTVYRGLRVWECPPNGQGLTALLALNILRGVDLAALDPLSPDRWHWQIEAARLAFADARRYIADPTFAQIPLGQLLSPDYAAERRAQIDLRHAIHDAQPGLRAGADTVYFCAVDGAGNACSLINSNYMGFGTGIVPFDAGGSWGFSLQNRGHNFSLDPAHPNCLAPRKRPYHTIIPGLLTHAADDALYGPFGVMGGVMQPQGHAQVVVALADDGLDPQAALNRLRFCIDPETPNGVVSLETGLPTALVTELRQRGHPVRAEISGYARALFGRGQIIRRDAEGVLWGGSDPRADGCAMGF